MMDINLKKEYKFKHIAIFGYPRSGSTMLYCMLRHTIKEYNFYDREIRAVDAHVREPDIPKITKNPMDMKQVDWLQKNVSKGGFILTIRDPRDVLCSKVADGRFKVNWDSCLHKKKGVLGKNDGFIDRNKLAVKSLEYNPLVIRYEEITENPNHIQSEIQTRFELEKGNKRFSDFHKASIPHKLRLRLNGIREVNTNKIGNWKNFPKRIYKQFTECPELFDILKFWKYEENNDWFEELKKNI